MESNRFDDYLKEELKDPAFKREWDNLQAEYAIAEAIIRARAENGVTQKELSERTGISQSDIIKFECGNGNPSLRTLKRLANGLGMYVKIEFVRENV